ncbi:MAG: hypothetical protein ABIF77_06795 [bacterium]
MNGHNGENTPNELNALFTSSFVRTVDGKGRFSLPAQFRRSGEALGNECFYATRGKNNTLCLMTGLEWAAAFAKMRRGEMTPTVMAQMRFMSRNSHKTMVDAQGRIQIPVKMLEQFGISERIEVVGMGHFMELWPPEGLDQHEQESPDIDEQFLGEFFS